jgi:type II secretory pathway pseudopilin PulG
MAALLIAMSIMAVMMTVAMPVWKQMSQREKEEELIFRGTQYARAFRLFGTKYANASPPNLDVLVEQRFLRKKYKDPITNDDFQPILAGQAMPGTGTPGATGSTGAPGQRGGGATGTGSSPFGAGISGIGGRAGESSGLSQIGAAGRGISPIGTPGAGGTGGIIGVTSKSKDKSIRIYNGRTHYNEWAFINTPQVQAPGAGGVPGVGVPGQRGGPGQNPFGGPGIAPPGGQRGRGNQPPGGGRTGPGATPFQPGVSPFGPGGSPFQPAQPIQPPPSGRGRGM